jgi:hypothetical protein
MCLLSLSSPLLTAWRVLPSYRDNKRFFAPTAASLSIPMRIVKTIMLTAKCRQKHVFMQISFTGTILTQKNFSIRFDQSIINQSRKMIYS